MKEIVLLVDDNAENLKVLGNILAEKKYKIAMAQNGKEALRLLEDLTPDLILLDIMMPEMDGIEVCKKIKNINKLADIPIIFLTAKTDTKDILQGFEVGGG